MFKVIFFATPDIALEVLDYLHQHTNLLAVVTQPDKPRERGGGLVMTPIKKRALEHNIPVFDPVSPKDPLFQQQVLNLKPDLFIVFAYGHILKKDLLDIPALGPINIHTSILPKYRGAAPIERAIMSGEKETGISIMKMDVGMDTGPTYLIHPISILDDMDAVTLKSVISQEAVIALDKFFSDLKNGRAALTAQDSSLATYAPKIQKEELELKEDFCKKMIYQIRALTSYGGVKFTFPIVDFIKVFRAKVSDEFFEAPFKIKDEKLYLRSLDGSVEVLELQIPGKKKMSVKEFLNGYKNKLSYYID